MKSWFHFVCLSVLSAAALLSQMPADRRSDYVVRGEIVGRSLGIDSLRVELIGQQNTLRDTVSVDPNGSFEFRSVQGGWRLLRVLNADGEVVYQETVLVSAASPSISIRLPDRPEPVRTSETTVSAKQLTHKVSAPARKAFEKGTQEASKGNHQLATQLFEQAVTRDPQYADAFNSLGVEEVVQGNNEQAVERFQKAIDLVPEHVLALTNLSITLLKLQRFDEAVVASRRGLQVYPGSEKLHYLLAIGLIGTKNSSDEVLEHLERSSNAVPRARLVAAILLAQRGKRAEAIDHAEAFLREAPDNDKERGRATELLVALRQ
jgi:tetratricopeptide (TPR) repeat protein